MNRDTEIDELLVENQGLHERIQHQEDELKRVRQANEDLREGLRLAISHLEADRKQIAGLEEVIVGLQKRVNTLEQRQAKDSHNSSLPPSSDRFVRVPKSLRKKSGKQPGGQPGHEGHALHQVEMPDVLLVHRVACCASCQYDLSAVPAKLAEKRQVIDVPEKRLCITEHQAEEKRCPACQHLTRACFPAGVRAPTQYGIGIQTVATYLVTGQVVPYVRASQLLHDLFGVQLSPASIARCVQDCSHHLGTWETHLKEAILKTPVIHQDETGMRVGKEGWWVHVCATKELTHYGAHRKRGREGMDEIGIAPLFMGISVHDGLRSYQGYRFNEALCNVHHLRDLTFIEEELEQNWAKEMKELLLSMKEAVEQACARGQPELEAATLAALLTRYDQIVQAGYQINPLVEKPPKTRQYKRLPGKPKQNPARNLLERFSTRKWDVLRFLLDFTVPFDNNQVERDLRMIKVQQKVSGCFRTCDGLISFCRIRSYLSTLRKQRTPIFAALEHRSSNSDNR